MSDEFDGLDSYSGGEPVGRPRQSVTPPDNHMVKAVLVTMFCCLPLGIVAIVNAAQVNGAARPGDIVQANAYAAAADKYSNWAIYGWLGLTIVYIGLIVLGGGLQAP